LPHDQSLKLDSLNLQRWVNRLIQPYKGTKWTSMVGERHIAIASDFVGQIGRNRQDFGNKMVTMLAI
jgi:hypothetical protein